MTDTGAGETYRAVGTKHIAAGEARTLLIRRRYDAPIEDVWAACTEPGRLDRWFLPVTGDLRVGGTFRLQDNADGEILRCEPPRLLTVTWVFGDREVDEVELRLSADGGDTVLELEHASVSRLVELDGRWVDPVLNDAATGIWGQGTGWELPLVHGLPKYLAGEVPDAPAAEWFEVSPEVLALADRCGAAWAAVVRTTGGDTG
ncbi:MAG TPA: SRPBCC family protein [Mycobacteriales bacterium]|jgi:uncharacterized protein YndB with AHSA1/START domain|nr:SRPBCC family protein [Mycobacteriales bacterium]